MELNLSSRTRKTSSLTRLNLKSYW